MHESRVKIHSNCHHKGSWKEVRIVYLLMLHIVIQCKDVDLCGRETWQWKKQELIFLIFTGTRRYTVQLLLCHWRAPWHHHQHQHPSNDFIAFRWINILPHKLEFNLEKKTLKLKIFPMSKLIKLFFIWPLGCFHKCIFIRPLNNVSYVQSFYIICWLYFHNPKDVSNKPFCLWITSPDLFQSSSCILTFWVKMHIIIHLQ